MKRRLYFITGVIMIAIIAVGGIFIKNAMTKEEPIDKLLEMMSYENCEYEMEYSIDSKTDYKIKFTGVKRGDNITANISDTLKDEVADIVCYNNDLYINISKVAPYIVENSEDYGKYFEDINNVKYILFNETTVSELDTIYGNGLGEDLSCVLRTTDKIKELSSVIKKEASSEETKKSLSWLTMALQENFTNTLLGSVVSNAKDITLDITNKNEVTLKFSRENNKVTIRLKMIKKSNEILVPNESMNVADLANRLMTNYIKLESGEN